MLKLKLQYFGDLTHWKRPWLGKIEGRRRRGRQRMRWLDGITDSMDEFDQALGVGDGQGSLACCSPWGRKESDTTERLNWTELNWGRRIYGKADSQAFPQDIWLRASWIGLRIIITSTECKWAPFGTWLTIPREFQEIFQRKAKIWECRKGRLQYFQNKQAGP